jgi:hypothetical protein
MTKSRIVNLKRKFAKEKNVSEEINQFKQPLRHKAGNEAY